MKFVFADTLYWMAISSRQDQWHQPAITAMNAMGDVMLVTTDEVLTEFVNAFSGAPNMRRAAAFTVRKILVDSNIVVIPQSRDGFLRALDRFDRRRDKQYSLVDCHSMNVMEAEGIQDVLTNDHHFAQEGFSVLIQRKS